MSVIADDFIREADALLQEKSHSKALVAFCRALDLDPCRALVHYNMGAIFLASDRPVESIPCLMTATSLEPGNAEFALTFSKALLRVGQRDRAAAILAQAGKAYPDNAKLREAAKRLPLRNDANAEIDHFPKRSEGAGVDQKIFQAAAFLNSGQVEPAFRLASELTWLAPQSADVWKLMSRAASFGASREYAEMCARRSVAINPADAEARLILAWVIRGAGGRQDDVEQVLRQGLSVCGPDETLAVALYEYLFGLNRRAAALEAIVKVEAELTEPSVKLMSLRANAHAHAGEINEAHETFTAALALQPTNLTLIGAAANFYESQADPSPMLDLLNKARSEGAEIRQDQLYDAEARVFLRQGKFDDAYNSITRALNAQSEKDLLRSRHFTLGQIQDKRGNFRDAFKEIEIANKLTEEIWERGGSCDSTMALRRLASLHRRLTEEIHSGENAVRDDNAGPENIVFLVGFPRSGTTLLDAVLHTHTKVSVFEEERIFINALRSAVGGPTGDETNFTEEWLTWIYECDPGVLRKKYVSQMAAIAGEDLAENKIYIDKLPLNMNWAPMIHKIFPRAVFILALRHPLDAAISNLYQDFTPNNAMMNMTSLARINDLYHASFSLWRDFEAWRRPIVEKISYEGVVSDLENAVSRVMERLGLKWEEAQSRYFETAVKRGRIKTPSYAQVTQKLYFTSKERWRNYAFALQGEDTARLRYWATEHGYSLDKKAD